MMQGDAATVAVYDNHPAAEEAVRMLHEAGFDMTKLSIVGKDFLTDERVVGFYNILMTVRRPRDVAVDEQPPVPYALEPAE